jgi:hypothetical protein
MGRLDLDGLKALEAGFLAEPDTPRRERPETLVDAMAANMGAIERALQLPGATMSAVARALGIPPSNFPAALARARRRVESGRAQVGRPVGAKDKQPRRLRADAAEAGRKGGTISRPPSKTPTAAQIAERQAAFDAVEGAEAEEFGQLPTFQRILSEDEEMLVLGGGPEQTHRRRFVPTWSVEGKGFVDDDEPNL